MDVGILSYGIWIPRHRIAAEEIARVWGKDGKSMAAGLGVFSKSVPTVDEDVVTMSVEAAEMAMKRCRLDRADVGAIYVGSESHPYAVKPTATVVAEAIGAAPDMTAADFEFACKAGTAGVQTCMGLVKSEMAKAGIAIGADTAQGAPGDALEYSASAGAAAFLISSDPGMIARIDRTLSYTTDTPDFWRREGQRYPSHGGRFTGVPAYFKHVVTCGQNLMDASGTTAEDYDHIVLHQPNGKFPIKAAKNLGFPPEKVETGLLTPRIGNTYSAASMLGLAAVLDKASPGERVLVVSYGSGAGSDAFDITVTDAIEDYSREGDDLVETRIAFSKFIDYAEYAKFRGKILMGGDGA
jgi:hydroxymethylglutaryl-CoA synthase